MFQTNTFHARAHEYGRLVRLVAMVLQPGWSFSSPIQTSNFGGDDTRPCYPGISRRTPNRQRGSARQPSSSSTRAALRHPPGRQNHVAADAGEASDTDSIGEPKQKKRARAGKLPS